MKQAIMDDIDALLAYLKTARPSRMHVARKVRALRVQIRDARDIDEALKLQTDEMLGKLVKAIFGIEPVSADFAARVGRLVDGVSVDLDAPIDGPVDLS